MLQNLSRYIGRELKLERVSQGKTASLSSFMQSEPPFAIWVPQDSPANSSIKRSFLGQMSPLVQQTLAGWRRGGRPGVPTCRAGAMVDDIARARIQNRAQRRQTEAFEVPWSGGNRPRAPQKWRPKVTFSLGAMYPSSPRAEQTTLTHFWRQNGQHTTGSARKQTLKMRIK